VGVYLFFRVAVDNFFDASVLCGGPAHDSGGEGRGAGARGAHVVHARPHAHVVAEGLEALRHLLLPLPRLHLGTCIGPRAVGGVKVWGWGV